ncbi:hypothetical protein LTR37_021301 [Vermiconidia calcicola]|uniref:Uncharacterized protein n=1 Tax=Vermiconidia calcicola TaxID=1690605 RepID=A0ACC3M991_9PEZI|nr:hypothetical protein LTR37_021301 [Vermiconidia calcicola]
MAYYDPEKERVDVVCVLTEAGTHWAGQRKAPEAVVKIGGLAYKLLDLDFKVLFHDVLSSDSASRAAAWRPAAKVDGVRNEANTVVVMEAVQQFLRNHQQDLQDGFTIVLGGDCSITLAVFSGLQSRHPEGTKVGLLYMDGDADLTLPSETSAEGSSAIMDSMTISHLTGRAGGLESMRAFSNADGSPLVTAENIVLFGFDPLQLAPEHWVYLLENGYKAYTRPTVKKDPSVCAEKALAWLQDRVDVIYVHFDVDVIDSGESPLANYPHYAGLEFSQAMSALQAVLQHRKVKGLTLTEVNPNNDPDGDMIVRLVDGLVEGVKQRKKL